jgi:hypothetical protein
MSDVDDIGSIVYNFGSWIAEVIIVLPLYDAIMLERAFMRI